MSSEDGKGSKHDDTVSKKGGSEDKNRTSEEDEKIPTEKNSVESDKTGIENAVEKTISENTVREDSDHVNGDKDQVKSQSNLASRGSKETETTKTNSLKKKRKKSRVSTGDEDKETAIEENEESENKSKQDMKGTKPNSSKKRKESVKSEEDDWKRKNDGTSAYAGEKPMDTKECKVNKEDNNDEMIDAVDYEEKERPNEEHEHHNETENDKDTDDDGKEKEEKCDEPSETKSEREDEKQVMASETLLEKREPMDADEIQNTKNEGKRVKSTKKKKKSRTVNSSKVTSHKSIYADLAPKRSPMGAVTMNGKDSIDEGDVDYTDEEDEETGPFRVKIKGKTKRNGTKDSTKEIDKDTSGDKSSENLKMKHKPPVMPKNSSRKNKNILMETRKEKYTEKYLKGDNKDESPINQEKAKDAKKDVRSRERHQKKQQDVEISKKEKPQETYNKETEHKYVRNPELKPFLLKPITRETNTHSEYDNVEKPVKGDKFAENKKRRKSEPELRRADAGQAASGERRSQTASRTRKSRSPSNTTGRLGETKIQMFSGRFGVSK